MSNNQTLGATLWNDLTNNVTVSVVSVLCAVVVLFGFAAISDVSIGSLLLALNVAVFIPYAYEAYWPEAYSTVAATIWTVSAACITSGVFIGVHELAAGLQLGDGAAGVAFVVTVGIQYGLAALFARVRRRG